MVADPFSQSFSDNGAAAGGGGGFDVSQLGAYGSGIGGALGIAGGIYSAITGSQDANKIRDIQKQIASEEMQQSAVRRQAMFVSSQRTQTENVRQAQFARSMALSSGTNQGAQFSSGLQGAYGSIGGAFATRQSQESQNLQFGNQMFDIAGQIDRLKMEQADAQAKLSGDTAFGGMLGGIGKNLGSIGNLAGLAFA